MDRGTQTEEQEMELLPPDEVEGPLPSSDQKKLWDTIDRGITIGSILREAKLLQLDEEKRKKLASISLAASIERLAKTNNFNENEGRLLALLIGRFAIHDLTLTILTQELGRVLGDEKSKKLMSDSSLRSILQSWAPDAVLFSDQTREDAARLSRSAPSFVAAPPLAAPKTIPSSPAQISALQRSRLTPPLTSPEANIGSEENAAPFILHEEKSAFTPATPRIQSSVNFDILRAPRSAPPQKPITAKIESPYEKHKESVSRRVVHYSNLRTPLDQDAQGK